MTVKEVTLNKAYINTKIKIKLDFYGMHYWPNADKIPEVSFLKHPHRHKFYVTIEIPVEHLDRDIEFIALKNKVQKLVDNWDFNLRNSSCEQLAVCIAVATNYYIQDKTDKEIYMFFPWVFSPWELKNEEILQFPKNIDIYTLIVEVSEDNENSAEIELFPTNETEIEFNYENEQENDTLTTH